MTSAPAPVPHTSNSLLLSGQIGSNIITSSGHSGSSQKVTQVVSITYLLPSYLITPTSNDQPTYTQCNILHQESI